MTLQTKSSLDRLIELLDSTPESIAQTDAASQDWKVLQRSPQVLLYGGGNLGQKIANGLVGKGYSITAIIDGNPARQGTSFNGIPVLDGQGAFGRFGDSLPVVVCVWNLGGTSSYEYIEGQLTALGFSKILSAMTALRMYPDVFLPHWRLDLPEKLLAARGRILEAYKLWSDTPSQELFVDQLSFSLCPTHLSLPGTATVAEQYVKQPLVPLGDNETFIDCGAFDGDTAQSFLKRTGSRFNQIICFEPDPINFQRLSAWRETLPEDIRSRISANQLGVSDRDCDLFTEAVGAGHSRVTHSGEAPVHCVSLDDFLTVVPTYIKMDIEGAEPEALQGASNVIRRSQTKLAICVYHKQGHLWEIPLQMKELVPEHTFHLEHHGTGPSDTVCYAFPKK